MYSTQFEFLEAVEGMVNVRSREPIFKKKLTEPIQFLLRDFHLSLHNNDPIRSQELLDRIDEISLLSSENLRFLRIERLACLGRWKELVSQPWFDDISKIRKPIRIDRYLLEAIWQTHFDSAAIGYNPSTGIEVFESLDIGSKYHSLISSTDVPKTAGGRKLVVLACRSSGNIERINRVIGSSTDTERSLLSELGGVNTTGRASPVEVRLKDTLSELAQSEFDKGKYSEVISLAENNLSEMKLIELAVYSVYELRDRDLASKVIDQAINFGTENLSSTRSFRKVLEEVESLANNRCDSWLKWFSRVSENIVWPEAFEVLRESNSSWSIEDILETTTIQDCANFLLEASTGVNRREIRSGLSTVCELGSAIMDRSVSDPLIDAILLVLSEDENPTEQVRSAFSNLMVKALRIGPSVERYQDLLVQSGDLWNKVKSPDAIPWALDLGDMILELPCPSPSFRINYFLELEIGAAGFWGRIGADQKLLLDTLAKESGTEIRLPLDLPEEEANLWEKLDGRTVGIYSLLENSGSRLEKRLKLLSPRVLVLSNGDKAATLALNNMVKAVDYLIVDTRHASHAATIAIDNLRHRDSQLFPQGGGISSFISCLKEVLENE